MLVANIWVLVKWSNCTIIGTTHYNSYRFILLFYDQNAYQCITIICYNGFSTHEYFINIAVITFDYTEFTGQLVLYISNACINGTSMITITYVHKLAQDTFKQLLHFNTVSHAYSFSKTETNIPSHPQHVPVSWHRKLRAPCG